MADRLPTYYWDTCIFLEHLRNEAVEPGKKRAVLQLLEDNGKKLNRIVTSVLTHTEAIPRKISATDATKEAQYWAYFNGVYFIDQEISRPVINLARAIRDFYFQEADPKTNKPYRIIGLGDSIHLATAIICDVDQLHTRDKKTSGGNLGLLKLAQISPNGKIAGQWKLNIVDPNDPQGNILDQMPKSPKN